MASARTRLLEQLALPLLLLQLPLHDSGEGGMQPKTVAEAVIGNVVQPHLDLMDLTLED